MRQGNRAGHAGPVMAVSAFTGRLCEHSARVWSNDTDHASGWCGHTMVGGYREPKVRWPLGTHEGVTHVDALVCSSQFSELSTGVSIDCPIAPPAPSPMSAQAAGEPQSTVLVSPRADDQPSVARISQLSRGSPLTECRPPQRLARSAPPPCSRYATASDKLAHLASFDAEPVQPRLPPPGIRD